VTCPVEWGDFSIVKALWKPLSWMVEHLDFDWMVSSHRTGLSDRPSRAARRTAVLVGRRCLPRSSAGIHLIEDADARKDRDLRYNFRYVQLPHGFGLMARLPPAVRRPIAFVGNYLNGALYRLQNGRSLPMSTRMDCPAAGCQGEAFAVLRDIPVLVRIPMQMALSRRAADP
jgi:hypothetical protein